MDERLTTKKVGIILASRYSSSRLPGKALLPLADTTVLGFLLDRLQPLSKQLKIVLATSNLTSDDPIVEEGGKKKVSVYRGSLDNVFQRYYEAAKKYGLDYVIRLTGDNPFVDSGYLSYLFEQIDFDRHGLYTTRPDCPKGLNVDAFPSTILESITKNEVLSSYDKEHVVPSISRVLGERGTFRLKVPEEITSARHTYSVDTAMEYERISTLVNFTENAKEESAASLIYRYDRYFE